MFVLAGMNTVALLFLCEIDEGAYVFLLSEEARSEVEKQGRVRLTGPEAAEITTSKTVHVQAEAMPAQLQRPPLEW